MKKLNNALTASSLFLLALPIVTQVHAQVTNTIRVNENAIGFAIPSFSTILSFIIKFFFVVAGIAALIYLLWGAFSWVTSGGDKGNVEKARDKIVNAIVGVLLIIVVVAVVATLEQVVFKQALCFGLTCDVTLPNLLDKRGP
ncbi:hypothetical protein HYS00_05230 [Candidatus Microgenomates bacterium]|nr:hypothetical protein [Candidatus Microgenomates bacterium]